MPDREKTRGRRLKCLWLTRVDPVPSDAGDLTYSFHLLSSLCRAGVRLTVLAMRRINDRARSTSDDGIEWVVAPRESDREIGGRVAVRGLFSRLPNVAAQYNTASFRRALRAQMARDWDAIVVDHLGMGWAWPAVEAYQRQNEGVVLVFIAHNCEAEVRRKVARNFDGNVIRRIGLSIDAVKVDRLEKKIIQRSDIVSAITDEDLCYFENSHKTILLSPGYADRHVARCEIDDAAPRRALLLGSAIWIAKEMNLIEFLAAADRVFYERAVELWVVGKVPRYLHAKSNFLATRFLGFVEDLEPIFRSVRIGIVAEQIGGGFKLKALDYIFNRVPIAAIKGSIGGLPLTPELHYLSFESMRELAEGVAAIIDNIERLNSLQQAAYEECNTGFDWDDRGRTLSNAIRQALIRKRAAHAKRRQ